MNKKERVGDNLIYDKLMDYKNQDIYPFHMPGHKRVKISEELPYDIDITEITGFDNLHEPKEIIKDCMDKMKEFYGTKATYMLVNGTTCGMLAAIHSVTNIGDSILISRNCHKSVYHGMELRDLRAQYLYPEINEKYQMFDQIDPLEIEKVMKENQKLKVVVVTSPNYEGIVLDIRAISNVVHEQNGILIVDEAHGAHLPYFEKFLPANTESMPRSSIYQGADIVVQSLHKTMPSLTQTSLLHICSDRVNEKMVEKYLGIFQTSSPSYPLIASIEKCFYYSQEKELYITCLKRIAMFRSMCGQLKNIHVLGQEDFPNSRLDPTRIVIATEDVSLNGPELLQILSKKYGIECEMAARNYVIAIATICDREEGFLRLYHALSEIDSVYMQEKKRVNKPVEKDDIVSIYNTITMLPSDCSINEAQNRRQENVPLKKAVGRISGEYIFCYPPGIPIIVPGEQFREDTITGLEQAIECGLNVIGVEGNGEVKVNQL